MEWLHLAGDIGASIAILVCLYFIWDLRKEVETLQDRLSGGSLPELDTLNLWTTHPLSSGLPLFLIPELRAVSGNLRHLRGLVCGRGTPQSSHGGGRI